MSIRKKLKYPPYSNLCLIKLSGINLDLLNSESTKIKDYLIKNTNNVVVLGPSLSSIPKIYNKYYVQIILKYKNTRDIYNQLKFIQNKLKTNSKIVLDIDFNPKKI